MSSTGGFGGARVGVMSSMAAAAGPARAVWTRTTAFAVSRASMRSLTIQERGRRRRGEEPAGEASAAEQRERILVAALGS